MNFGRTHTFNSQHFGCWSLGWNFFLLFLKNITLLLAGYKIFLQACKYYWALLCSVVVVAHGIFSLRWGMLDLIPCPGIEPPLPILWAWSLSHWTTSKVPCGFLCGSDSKEPACNVGDAGSIPGSGRSPGERNGNPLQYSCLENPMDGGAWQAIVHRVTKSRTWLRDFTFFLSRSYSEILGSLWVLLFICDRQYQSSISFGTNYFPLMRRDPSEYSN